MWQCNTWLLHATVISHMRELILNPSPLAAGSYELLIAKAIQQNERYYVSLCCNHSPWSWLSPKWVRAVVDPRKSDFSITDPEKRLHSDDIHQFWLTFYVLGGAGMLPFPTNGLILLVSASLGGGVPLLPGG